MRLLESLLFSSGKTLRITFNRVMTKCERVCFFKTGCLLCHYTLLSFSSFWYYINDYGYIKCSETLSLH